LIDHLCYNRAVFSQQTVLQKTPYMSHDITKIRNFSIIAHIDHGKSTLADRFIQVCGGLEDREMEAQVLDSMDIERERGITIKAQSVAGVEAQTVANCYTAVDLGLEVLPVLNKIDLPAADVDRVSAEIEDVVGIDCSEALHVSAKSGIGVSDLLEQIVRDLPAPEGDETAPLQALIMDSWFDSYLGTVSLIRIVQGRMEKKDRIKTRVGDTIS